MSGAHGPQTHRMLGRGRSSRKEDETMVMIANGTLVRESDRPEVWYVENSVRRWVPDPPTLETLGGWGRVELVQAPARVENPLGPMYPSTMAPQDWDDGSLLRADPDPA